MVTWLIDPAHHRADLDALPYDYEDFDVVHVRFAKLRVNRPALRKVSAERRSGHISRSCAKRTRSSDREGSCSSSMRCLHLCSSMAALQQARKHGPTPSIDL